MVNQVCMRSDYFIAFLLITLAIIGWVIYQMIIRYQQVNMNNVDKFDNLYENLTALIQGKKDEKKEEDKSENTVPVTFHSSPPSPPPIIDRRFPPILRYGTYGDFQLVGYVYPHHEPDQMFRLMGRQYNTTRYEYYVVHPYTDIKIPIKVKNDWELNTGDHIHIPGFHGHYTVQIYDDYPF